MKSLLTFLVCSFFILNLQAQDEDKISVTEKEAIPYVEIPEAPEVFSAEGVAARMIDGLGYRYHWATKGLRTEDLEFKPGETNRTTAETLDHLFNLSKTILNAVKKEPNIRGGGEAKEELDFEKKRKQTLLNFKTASDLLRAKDANVEDMKIVFQRGERKSEFPFWNLINGPIADAIWHTGQVVSFRRAAGNPLPAGVNVFSGRTRE